MAEGLSNDSGVVLLVDDDPDVLTSARVLLGRNGYQVLAARSPAEAWSRLAERAADVILLDLNFSRGATSGAEGFAWLGELRAQDPDAVVVVVTGHSGINVAVAAMKAGASDFVMKPWTNARLLDTVRDAVALGRQRRRVPPPAVDDAGLLLGDSPAFQRVRDLVTRVAPTSAAVLVTGPPGSGKTLVARALHARSRRPGSVVSLEARDLTADAAPAAVREALAAADGGSLVIEAVGALPGPGQTALVAAMDEGAPARLIATSQGPVGGLREELLARLNTIEIALPRLEDRGDDVVLLTEHFVRLFSRRHGRAPRPLDGSALELLKRHPPPGDVRGLRQAAERAVVLGLGEVLGAEDFAPAPGGDPGKASDLNLARSEKAIVAAALKRHAHNVSHAARELGLTRAALYRRMVKHGL